ncbi:methylmalonyl Co-A mutase-associated GTPase MeaB [Longimicrobium terrae]|uniref:LAO/AO transport system kinase n=1 Tax=Longimicrobium terrae TaxID=1639882 RepID=A0A841GLM8_9BACT|nr:methylmalonyl Co-A mutase-associated GTPase MeaB [Longimicrobium terrae]MBB4635277.1 LAO/AO transport system kinase [Longimicrobium terrae]MBB6069671.1 LAO/AO transport system kinase [Longimicrobium terrae]NNC31118.1 methylmalonyl Co-A mutase-associated GTPase MeaB [Longimicrobium terrae]
MTSEITAAAPADLLERFRDGKRTALARAISIVEDARPGFERILHELFGDMGRAHRIGITGPPGAGKSTLTSKLALHLRQAEERIGIVAVDPSSPFTGGALLGDRIRMNNISTDPGIFIRSMATRGHLGGLATTTKEVADLIDAFGYDRVILETVGVGQSELEIAGTADTSVVVLVPESGDSIQAMKAGLMEVADIFVINKADRPGADRLAQEIEVMLHMRLGDMPQNAGHHGVSLKSVQKAAREGVQAAAEQGGGWAIPVLKTVAQTGEGLEELARTLDRHRVYLEETGELSRRRQARLAERVRAVVERRLRRLVWLRGPGEGILADELAALEAGQVSPYAVADRIVNELGLGPAGGMQS